VDWVVLALFRDLADESQPLVVRAAENEPMLDDAMSTFRRGLPAPPTTEAFVLESYYRPPGSARSFYQRLAGERPRTDGRHRGVVAIKGMEPLSPTFRKGLLRLTAPGHTPHTVAEHFVVQEGKVPACLTLDEAVTEAQRALELQRAHVAAYGQLARIPLPLFVFRHTDDTVTRVSGQLAAILSDTAGRLTSARASDGLGVYLYYYPSAPLRVTHLEYLLRGRPFGQRTLALLSICDPDVTIRRWVRVFVRMLYLGYLPGSLASLHTGLCCQPQNACVDGGFVDVDSVTPLSALRSDTDVTAALAYSVEEMVRTEDGLLTSGVEDPRLRQDRVRVDRHHVSDYVFRLIRQSVQSEARPGLEMDPRVMEYLEPAHSADELVTRLAAYFDSPRRGLSSGWDEFGHHSAAWIDDAQGDNPGYG
jgi:hypothetical protein